LIDAKYDIEIYCVLQLKWLFCSSRPLNSSRVSLRSSL